MRLPVFCATIAATLVTPAFSYGPSTDIKVPIAAPIPPLDLGLDWWSFFRTERIEDTLTFPYPLRHLGDRLVAKEMSTVAVTMRCRDLVWRSMERCDAPNRFYADDPALIRTTISNEQSAASKK